MYPQDVLLTFCAACVCCVHTGWWRSTKTFNVNFNWFLWLGECVCLFCLIFANSSPFKVKFIVYKYKYLRRTKPSTHPYIHIKTEQHLQFTCLIFLQNTFIQKQINLASYNTSSWSSWNLTKKKLYCYSFQFLILNSWKKQLRIHTHTSGYVVMYSFLHTQWRSYFVQWMQLKWMHSRKCVNWKQFLIKYQPTLRHTHTRNQSDSQTAIVSRQELEMNKHPHIETHTHSRTIEAVGRLVDN